MSGSPGSHLWSTVEPLVTELRQNVRDREQSTPSGAPTLPTAPRCLLGEDPGRADIPASSNGPQAKGCAFARNRQKIGLRDPWEKSFPRMGGDGWGSLWGRDDPQNWKWTWAGLAFTEKGPGLFFLCAQPRLRAQPGTGPCRWLSRGPQSLLLTCLPQRPGGAPSVGEAGGEDSYCLLSAFTAYETFHRHDLILLSNRVGI